MKFITGKFLYDLYRERFLSKFSCEWNELSPYCQTEWQAYGAMIRDVVTKLQQESEKSNG
jgi:hypothetical protein